MSVDMRTIAAHVGVSRTTVHRALTNTGRISEDTRRKILQAARELGYLPNDLARGLRSRRSAVIGYATPGMSPFQASVLAGVEDVADRNGYSILIACSWLNQEREIRGLDTLREKRVDGIIACPAHPQVNADYYRRLLDTGPPFVFIDREMPGVETDCVTTDNYTGGLLAGRHLVSLGRKKMVFGCVPGTEMQATSVTERLRGFRAALVEAGLPLVAMIGEGRAKRVNLRAHAAVAMAEYLQDGRELDAVFAVNDGVASGMMCALRRTGLKVPDDVSVVGFDGLEVALHSWPPLTTIKQPTAQMGREAMRLLLERISVEGAARSRERIVLTPKLVIAGSCGSTEYDPSDLSFDDHYLP